MSTREDIAEIKQLNEQIHKHYRRIQEIKDNCTHEITEPLYVETFVYEFDPKLICHVCGKKCGEPTREQKLALLQEWYNDIECELTEEIINEKLKGFNL